MSLPCVTGPGLTELEASPKVNSSLGLLLSDRRLDRVTLALAVCTAPLSIAVSETFLFSALLARTVRLVRHRTLVSFPRILWFWVAWAGLEILSWLFSPDLRAGRGEISHLFLLAVLFVALPALDQARYRVAVWRGVFIAATISSTFLIGEFVFRLIHYSRQISVSPDPILYIRVGGLLNHWMIYGTVEILVFAGLLAFWNSFPEDRKAWLPVYVLNSLAIILSMTRMLWVCCLLLLGIDLVWRRSKWVWALPFLPLAFLLLAPGVLRTRLRESLDPEYYSNAERVQMLRVGWKMVKDHPLTGVGPGRIEALYVNYLAPKEPVPAYHGHLHDNLVQLAAEFGLPVVAAALAFVVALGNELRKQWKTARSRETLLLCRVSILGLIGFVVSGFFDYTYGHSLGLIVVSFAVLTPLLPTIEAASSSAGAGI
jgi:O-antigen ligase